jgi:hypothetical protein
MQWFVLKNRRHYGPFQENQLQKLKKKGEINPLDFIISKEKADLGELTYQKLADVFPAWAKTTTTPTSGGVESTNQAPGKSSKPLGEFSEEEILKSEVSRVFLESLDSVELLKTTGELTRTNFTQTSSRVLPPKPKLSRYNPVQAQSEIVIDENLENSLPPKKSLKKYFAVASFALGFLALILAPLTDDKLKPFRDPASLPKTDRPTAENAGQSQPALNAVSGQSTGWVPGQIKVPEVVDDQMRRRELEREREMEQREREARDEREAREREKNQAEEAANRVSGAESQNESDKDPPEDNADGLEEGTEGMGKPSKQKAPPQPDADEPMPEDG